MLAIFSNDDVGASPNPQSAEDFRTVVRWLDSLGLHGSFFWVPEPHDWAVAHANWRETLDWACGRGHDFQLHGLSHGTCLEFGLPQASTRVANPAPFEEYEAHREHWQCEHGADRLRQKLERGLTHYAETFGGRPCAFRAPCFGVSPGMYEALHAVGIPISSSRGINPTATAWALGKLEGPNTGGRSAGIRPGGRMAADGAAIRPLHDLWQPDFPCAPWIEPPGVLEIPCMEDLCLGGVGPGEGEERLALVISELEHFLAEATEDSVLVIGSHYSSMMSTWEQTRPLLEAMFEWLARQGITEWVTFAQAAAILTSD